MLKVLVGLHSGSVIYYLYNLVYFNYVSDFIV